MNLFGVMEIAGSALGAERLRAEVVASNMANLETTRTADGGPYRRRLTVFQAQNMPGLALQVASFGPAFGPALGQGLGRAGQAGGVRIQRVVTDTAPPFLRYQPGHPDADAKGYVAYSSSQVDHKKVGKLARAIEVAFQAMGVFPSSGTSVPLQADGEIPPGSIQMLSNIQPSSSIGRVVSPSEGELGGVTENGTVANLRKDLEKALAPEIFKKDVALRTEPDGLVISLREVGFFASGSAQLRVATVPAFRKIAEVLLQRPYQIRIEGHTDNIAIHTAQFSSNWELSTARAIEVIRLLISDMGFPPERLSAGGYGQFHPVTSNATEEGRSQNRRVDIVILRRSIAVSSSASASAAHQDALAEVKKPPTVVPDSPRVVETSEKPSPSQAAPQ